MRCFLATPPIRRRCGGFSNASSGNPPLVLVRPRPPSTDARDHLKPADADHPLRFECRIEITHKSISQNCGDCGAPRRPSECAVTAPLTTDLLPLHFIRILTQAAKLNRTHRGKLVPTPL